MATTETSTNGFTNGGGAKVQTNGTNGVHHHPGVGGSGEHEEMQYLHLIRRIVETGGRVSETRVGGMIPISQE